MIDIRILVNHADERLFRPLDILAIVHTKERHGKPISIRSQISSDPLRSLNELILMAQIHESRITQKMRDIHIDVLFDLLHLLLLRLHLIGMKRADSAEQLGILMLAKHTHPALHQTAQTGDFVAFRLKQSALFLAAFHRDIGQLLEVDASQLTLKDVHVNLLELRSERNVSASVHQLHCVADVEQKHDQIEHGSVKQDGRRSQSPQSEEEAARRQTHSQRQEVLDRVRCHHDDIRRQQQRSRVAHEDVRFPQRVVVDPRDDQQEAD
mmetsp:Transcript_22576/g.36103  ORF Transcript_22576/g.36103 Transcript_22576/m.36103 type:complete len:267 (-) Transcript_22576:369-1169(-)